MPEIRLYRRVAPNQCKKSLHPNAFIPREGEGLSTYCADVESPRGLLQRLIDDLVRKTASEDEEERQKAERMLMRNGNTVDLLLTTGWRVAKIPLSAFNKSGLQIVGPDDEGHVDIRGDVSIFQEHSLNWIEQASLLSPDECRSDSLLPTG